jgi:hypothetical protein
MQFEQAEPALPGVDDVVPVVQATAYHGIRLAIKRDAWNHSVHNERFTAVRVGHGVAHKSKGVTVNPRVTRRSRDVSAALR